MHASIDRHPIALTSSPITRRFQICRSLFQISSFLVVFPRFVGLREWGFRIGGPSSIRRFGLFIRGFFGVIFTRRCRDLTSETLHEGHDNICGEEGPDQ